MVEEEKKNGGGWSEVRGGEVVLLDKVGDSFEGKLVDVRSNVGENNSMMYDFERGDKLHSVWGSTVLDGKLRRVKIGDWVKIVFLGEKPSEKRKGRNYKDFQVFVKEPENEGDV